MNQSNLKSVAFRYQANPGIGVSSLSGNHAVNIVFSNVPVNLVAVELVDLLISDVSATSTKRVFYAKSVLFKTPISQVRDIISATVFSGTTYEGVIQPIFIYNERPVGFWRPIDLKILPSDSFSFGFSLRFESLTAIDDSVTIVQRLWFEELK